MLFASAFTNGGEINTPAATAALLGVDFFGFFAFADIILDRNFILITLPDKRSGFVVVMFVCV